VTAAMVKWLNVDNEVKIQGRPNLTILQTTGGLVKHPLLWC